jgi:hypothetical protein
MQTQTEGRLARIERNIDREVAGNLAISRSTAGTFTIMPRNVGEIMEFAKMMAVSDFCVRPGFRGNPGACLAVALQAFRCGGDPFAWANKAYITKSKSGDEQISYEAQLIHAIVTSSGVLQKRLRPVYEGQGTKRKCKIIGYIKGEEEPFEYESPTVEEIAVKNSPLWTADRDQQLYYYTTRAWARRYVPEILLGIYAPEEMGDVIDMEPETPEPQRVDYREPEPEPELFAVVALDGEVFEFEAPANAVDALRTVLTGARRAGPKMLEAAIENNAEVMTQLGEAGAMLLAEFPPPAPSAPRTEAPAPVPDPAHTEPGRATPTEPPGSPPEGQSAAPPSQPSQAAAAPSAPPPAAAAPTDDDDRFPGDLPPGQRLGGVGDNPPISHQREEGQVLPPTQVAAAPGTSQDVMVDSPAPTVAAGASSSAGPGPNATTPASPSEGERQSKFIGPPPMSRGRPDYRTYVRGLLIPKVKQQTSSDDLAWLLSDNNEHIEQARSAVAKPDIDELDQAIEATFARLRP